MQRFVALILGALVLLLAERTSGAYTFDPISRVFAPAGSSATQSFEVHNDGAERIALTVSFFTLDRDDAYVETNREADDEFLAYPAQMIVAPGARQTIRVTWLGTHAPTKELAYRMVVTQLPIEKLDPSATVQVPRGHVQVLLTYRGTLLIRPPRATPDVAIQSAVETTTKNGRALVVTLANRGTASAIVRACTVRLTTAAHATVEVSPTELRNTRVLAGDRRQYVVPWPQGLVGPLQAAGQCSLGG